MAAESLKRLRNKIMALSESNRAELAHGFIQSLDNSCDEGVEDAWDHEVLRRIVEIDAGQAKLLDREELQRRMRQGLRPGSAPGSDPRDSGRRAQSYCAGCFHPA